MIFKSTNIPFSSFIILLQDIKNAQAESLKNVLSGLGFLASSSGDVFEPPLSNKFQDAWDMILAYRWIDVQIRNENIFLWDSNKPRLISEYTDLVILSSRYINLSYRSSLFLAYSIATLNSFLKYCSEYWYIGSIPDKSYMTKYKTVPRIATFK